MVAVADGAEELALLEDLTEGHAEIDLVVENLELHGDLSVFDAGEAGFEEEEGVA